MRPEDVDLLDRDVFARGVPHEWFTWLREHHPVFRHPEPDGPSFWAVSKQTAAASRLWRSRRSRARGSRC